MANCRILWIAAFLFFAYGEIIAKQASPDQAKAKSNGYPPASTADSDLTPPAILIPLPKRISESPDPKPITRVEAEALNTSGGGELDAYLDTSVLAIIRANWFQVVSKSGEKIGGDATIQFTITRDGGILDTKLTDGSGHALLGALATKAIQRSGPFPPLPAKLGSLEVRAKFSYQPEVEDQTKNKAGSTPPTCKQEDSNCVTPPQILLSSISQEAHPHDSDAAKYTGKAFLQLIVTIDGTPSDIKVLKSLGPGLDAKAIASVQKMKFVPAMKNGKPVATQIQIEVEFHLD